jgi:hypothetical protein
MDFSEYINIIADFCRTNPFAAVACGMLLLCLFYKKPKFFMSVLALALVLVVMVHFILDAASSGSYLKQEMIDNSGIHKQGQMRSERFSVSPASSFLSIFKYR